VTDWGLPRKITARPISLSAGPASIERFANAAIVTAFSALIGGQNFGSLICNAGFDMLAPGLTE
jgi:hypothetical protein